MDNRVTVGAQRHEVCLRIHGLLPTKIRNRYYVMDVNEALRVFAVCLFEIKPACLAVQPMDSDGFYP
ncbi:hypothetical protein D3C77_600000 [compost metagenome]